MASPDNSSQAGQSSAVAGHITPQASQGTSAAGAKTSEGTDPPQVDQVRGGTKRKLISEVWNEFTKEFVGGKWQAQCMHCHKWLSATSTNGTKHLSNHLKTCPARSAPLGLTQQKLKLLKGEDGKLKVENYIFDQEVARKELALMICAHEYPLSMVDHSGFRRFCGSLQPMFKMVSRNSIRKDILGMHEVQKDKMVKYFVNFKNRVAITTDMWTASHQKRGFMAVTAHYVDESWKLKSYLLRFVYVPCPHTSEVICQALHECLVDWHLERKVSTITLDNCTSNDKAIEFLLDKLDYKSLMLNGTYLHMRCCAHILNLIVKDGMSVMESGIGRVRDNIAFWSATPKRHEKFEKMARTMNIEYTRRLSLDCKTRWNSTYTMLSIALRYMEIFEELSSRDKLFTCCPTQDDWKFAKELCDRLKMFFDITELFSGTKYVTSNLFFPKICGIRLAIQKWAASDNNLVQEMSEEMNKKFEKYWKDVYGLMAVATVLNPRYKLHMLQALFGSLYGYEHATRKVEKIRKLMVDLLEQYQEDCEVVGTSEIASTNIQDGVDEVFDIFDQYMSSQSVIIACQVRTELDLYLEEPTLPRTQELDIINWWKFGGIKYPSLQRIAHDILPIPVTSVASESTFSTSGRILSPHRSRLTPTMAEALMCMQAWSRADMLGDSNASLFAAFQTVLEDEEEMMDETEFIITLS